MRAGHPVILTGLEDTHGVVAVSYTHLRAHETVLDLVCRLLLEKKSHQVYSHVLRIMLVTVHGTLRKLSLNRADDITNN